MKKLLETDKYPETRTIKVQKNQIHHEHTMTLHELRQLFMHVYDNVPVDVEITAHFHNDVDNDPDDPGVFDGINLTWYEDIEDGTSSDVASEPEVDVDRKARDRRRKRRSKDR
jgi:hypothetical protein